MATVSKGRTFVSGETVTPAKLNELVDSATVTAIQTADIADGQITSAKIADGTIVNADVSASAAIAYSKLSLASSIVAGDIASDAITTTKILNANVTPAKLSQPYTLDTAKASTSGTNIDFTGIPSWAKRITVMFSGISTSGTSDLLLQIGSGSFLTTGYNSASIRISAGAVFTTGFGLTGGSNSGAYLLGGIATLVLISGSTWAQAGTLATSSNAAYPSAGNVTLSGTLDRVRVTTVNGTDTFDAGTINISYEG